MRMIRLIVRLGIAGYLTGAVHAQLESLGVRPEIVARYHRPEDDVQGMKSIKKDSMKKLKTADRTHYYYHPKMPGPTYAPTPSSTLCGEESYHYYYEEDPMYSKGKGKGGSSKKKGKKDKYHRQIKMKGKKSSKSKKGKKGSDDVFSNPAPQPKYWKKKVQRTPACSPTPFPTSTTSFPTITAMPTITAFPTVPMPTTAPVITTEAPTTLTASPTSSPTAAPTDLPTSSPTGSPTDIPTFIPTTAVPTEAPSTAQPTGPTTSQPTSGPTLSPVPPGGGTDMPSAMPSVSPSAAPSIDRVIDASPFFVLYEFDGADPAVTDADFQQAAAITASYINDYFIAFFEFSDVSNLDNVQTRINEFLTDPIRIGFDVSYSFSEDSSFIPSQQELDNLLIQAFQLPNVQALQFALRGIPGANPFANTADASYVTEAGEVILEMSAAENLSGGTSGAGKAAIAASGLLIAAVLALFVTQRAKSSSSPFLKTLKPKFTTLRAKLQLPCKRKSLPHHDTIKTIPISVHDDTMSECTLSVVSPPSIQLHTLSLGMIEEEEADQSESLMKEGRRLARGYGNIPGNPFCDDPDSISHNLDPISDDPEDEMRSIMSGDCHVNQL